MCAKLNLLVFYRILRKAGVYMSNFSFKYFVEDLSDTSFVAIKEIMQEYREVLCKMQKNETVSVLLKIICDDHVISTLQKDDYVAIMDSLFYDEIKNQKIALLYMEKLNEVLESVADAFQEQKNGRAADYYDHIQNKLFAEAQNKKYKFWEKPFDEQVRILNDYTKIAIALYAWAKQSNLENDLKTPFELNIDAVKTEAFLSQLAGVSQSAEVFSMAHKFAVEKADLVGYGIKKGLRKGISVFAKEKSGVVLDAVKQLEKNSDKLVDFAIDTMKPGVEILEQSVSRKLAEMEQCDEKRLYIMMIVWLLYLRIYEEDSILWGGVTDDSAVN